MKKVMSLLVMVMFVAGMAMAQNNSATATQTGDKNTSTQTQTGDGNNATVDQVMHGNANKGIESAQGHTATQLQEGTDNSASLNQEDWGTGSGAFGSTSLQEQYGELNNARAGVRHDNNSTEQYQYGYSNASRLGVGGENNVVKTQQGEDGGNVSGNWTVVEIGGDDNAQAASGFDFLGVKQINGDENEAWIDIIGNQNKASVVQDGSGNNVGLRSMNGQGVSIVGDGNEVGVRQIGNENDASVEVYGGSNTSMIDQYRNEDGGINAVQANEASVIIEGTDNNSTIDQEGTFNQATHTIQGSAVSGNVAETEQDGNNNIAEIAQESDGNVAKQVQDAWNHGVPTVWGKDDNNEADFNESYITQKGGNGNVAETYQFGDQNVANVIQEGAGNSVIADQGIWDQRPTRGKAYHGKKNQLTVRMLGDGNEFDSKQVGSENIMDFDLYDHNDGSNNGNKIVARQTTYDNVMKVDIKGDNNKTFNFVQNKGMNVIKGLEDGITDPDYFFYEGDEAKDFTIHQDGFKNMVEGEIWHGKGIDLNVQQMGDFNYTELDLQDHNNVIDVDQTSPYSITSPAQGNQAWIYQRGGAQNATVNQIGTANDATIIQNP